MIAVLSRKCVGIFRFDVKTWMIALLLAFAIVFASNGYFGHTWSMPPMYGIEGTHHGIGHPNSPRCNDGDNFTLWTFINGTWCARGNLTKEEMNLILADEGIENPTIQDIIRVLRVFEGMWLK